MTQFPIFEANEADLLAGERLFREEVRFLKGVTTLEALPPVNRVEFCMAGRSNVGKSSLINALTRRKSLARASSTPGRTQEVNFFELGADHYMVDLPGYGFAKAPLPVVAKWQELLRQYLMGRPNLRRVFLLIDARHGAKDTDTQIMTLLDKAAVTFEVVLTKVDKVNPLVLEENLEKTRLMLAKHPTAFPGIILTSAEKNYGVEALRGVIAGL